MPKLPKCLGKKCEFYVFTLTEIKATSYSGKDANGQPVTGNNPTDDMKTAFTNGVQALYEPYGTGCDDDCICKKTSKVLEGPTDPEAEDHTHTIDDVNSHFNGYEIKGSYKVSLTIYQGLCIPKPKGGTKSTTKKETPKKKGTPKKRGSGRRLR